ncbi:MAG: response regulator transcription factor [Bacteroidota bacterium]
MNTTLNLAIVEDDPVMRKSLTRLLSSDPQLDVNLICESAEDFLAALQQSVHRPDIILLDVQLPQMDGISAIPYILQHLPQADIVILTTFEEDEKIFAALCAGASSYISKRTSLRQISDAIAIIRRGGSFMSPNVARKVVRHFSASAKPKPTPLTNRQKEIVQAIVDGLSYQMVADQLGISIDTVRTHIRKIYRALNINNKVELVRKVMKGEV